MWLFYRRHHPQLLKSVARRLREHRGEAEAVCQEIWQGFFRRFDHFLTYQEPLKGLYAIAHCRLADYWKDMGRQPARADGENLELMASTLVSRLDKFSQVEGRVDLARALAKIPDRQREALTLHYLDDLPVTVTARLMGIGENGAKNLIKKGLAGLRGTPFLDSYRPASTSQEVRK